MNSGSVLRLACVALIGSTTLNAQAQVSWVEAGIPVRTEQMFSIYTDTVTQAIYFCGRSSLDGDHITDDCVISVYYQGQWDTLGVLRGTARDIVRWQDTLVVTGEFFEINGDPIEHCAYYDSVGWHSYGIFNNTPQRLKVVDGELYALGAFTQVDGVPCRGVVKKTGAYWEPISSDGFTTDPNLFNWPRDIIRHNGQLLLTGQLHFDGTTACDVAIQVDGVWQLLGPGLQGSFTTGARFIEYQGELYLGGGIHVAEGNAGEGLIKWNGSDFEPVGGGLQNQNNQWALNIGVYDLDVHDGLLYVAGNFHYAGFVPANGVATWDGANWCGLGSGLGLPVSQLDFVGDTLFAAPLWNVNGEYANSAARYVGTYPDTCTQNSTALAEWPGPAQPFQVSVRSSGELSISGIGGSCGYSIHSADGRLLHQGRLSGTGGGTIQIIPPPMAAGAYVFRCPFGASAFFTP